MLLACGLLIGIGYGLMIAARNGKNGRYALADQMVDVLRPYDPTLTRLQMLAAIRKPDSMSCGSTRTFPTTPGKRPLPGLSYPSGKSEFRPLKCVSPSLAAAAENTVVDRG